MFKTSLTGNTWDQLAPQQAYNALEFSKLISQNRLTAFDPIYGKLMEEISHTIYHKLSLAQQWTQLGISMGMNEYTGMVRELIMLPRKGQNFATDNGSRPTTLNSYKIYNDEIEVRYHSTQVRWSFPYTIFDEELRRFSGGKGTTISELTEMKQINAANARNLFIDNFKKQLLNILATNVAKEFTVDIDISKFDTLTKEQAQSWLNKIDNLLFTLKIGTALYNTLNIHMQVPASRLQMIMPYEFYNNLIRRAYPDTYNTKVFQNILPDNLLLMDTLGGDGLYDGDNSKLSPTFNAEGMNLLKWDASKSTASDETIQAIIMDTACLGVEDNLNTVMVGIKDIDVLATPVRNHYWTKGFITDLLTCVKVKYVPKVG